jgi:thiamine kinase-like enzyme
MPNPGKNGMLRLGEGTSQSEQRAEAAILGVLEDHLQINRSDLAYTQIVGPVASPMHSGIDGSGWRVISTSDPSYFLKLYDDDTAEFLDLRASFKAAAAAASAGVAPKLLWSSELHRAAMWENKAEPWRTAIFDDSWNSAVFSQVANSLRQLHGGPCLGRSRSVFETLGFYVDIARQRKVVLPVDFDWMLDNVLDIASAFSAAGADKCFCHGDLIPSNIMIGPAGETVFVDWDEACDGDPYWDLGMYIAEAFPFDEPALAMIEAYAGRADRKLLARARLYGITGDLTCAMRSLILAHQTRRTEVEHFKYGQWRALRCRVALHDPKFEQMLRLI